MNDVRVTKHAPNKKQSEGCYSATLYLEDGSKKYKQSAIHLHGDKLAHEIVDCWAMDMAKEHGQEYKAYSKDFTRRKYGSAASEPTLKKHFLISKINTALSKSDCIDDLIESFEQCVLHLKDCKIKAKEDLVKKKSANEEIANTMFDIYKKTGMDMSSSISDINILTIYRGLISGG